MNITPSILMHNQIHSWRLSLVWK